jgi:hypothetical protein
MAKSVGMRVSPEFRKICHDLANERLQKGLIKDAWKEGGTPEITRLLPRSQWWNKVVEDLKTKPKREHLINGGKLS